MLANLKILTETVTKDNDKFVTICVVIAAVITLPFAVYIGYYLGRKGFRFNKFSIEEGRSNVTPQLAVQRSGNDEIDLPVQGPPAPPPTRASTPDLSRLAARLQIAKFDVYENRPVYSNPPCVDRNTSEGIPSDVPPAYSPQPESNFNLTPPRSAHTAGNNNVFLPGAIQGRVRIRAMDNDAAILALLARSRPSTESRHGEGAGAARQFEDAPPRYNEGKQSSKARKRLRVRQRLTCIDRGGGN